MIINNNNKIIINNAKQFGLSCTKVSSKEQACFRVSVTVDEKIQNWKRIYDEYKLKSMKNIVFKGIVNMFQQTGGQFLHSHKF